jgi:uncharacterized protein YhjY with autotransporter beta-barrel domain
MRLTNMHPFIKSGLIAGFLALNLAAQQAYAARADQNFRQYIIGQCETSVEFVSTLKNFMLCTTLIFGGYDNVTGRDSIVLPTGGDSRKDTVKPDLQVGGTGGSTTVSGGSEDGGFGYLVTPYLSSETERTVTENENAFDSEMTGYMLGVDYRFSDAFVLGLSLSSTEDKASIAGDAGRMKTESEASTLYAVLTPTNNLTLDVYYGNADGDVDTRRNVLTETFSGTLEGVTFSSFKNSQDFQGASVNYDWYLGDWSVGLLAAYDSVETEIDGYSEEGSTNLELRFPDQIAKSVTTSTGLRGSYSMGYGWGNLIPNFKFTAVKEHENDARTIGISMADSLPGIAPFMVQTDAPDRKYAIGGVGLIAAFSGGSQLYMNCEKRSSHAYIEDTSTMMGLLFEF